MAQGDRLSGVGVGDLHVVEVGIHVLVEVEPALLHQLHHRGRGEELAGGGYPEQRLVGDDGLVCLHVGLAVALCKEDFPVTHDGDRSTRDVVALELLGEEPVHEGLDLPRVGGTPARRPLRGRRAAGPVRRWTGRFLLRHLRRRTGTQR
jgi:hypothetical protein